MTALWVCVLAGVSPWIGLPRLSLAIPLSLSIAIVYKTLRLPRLSRLPLSALWLTLTILAGMAFVGVALLILHELVLRSY
jgi:hypothetical protein